MSTRARANPLERARANVCRERKEIRDALSRTGTRRVYYSANMARIRARLDALRSRSRYASEFSFVQSAKPSRFRLRIRPRNPDRVILPSIVRVPEFFHEKKKRKERTYAYRTSWWNEMKLFLLFRVRLATDVRSASPWGRAGKRKAKEWEREGAGRNTKPVSIDPARTLPYRCIGGKAVVHDAYFTSDMAAHAGSVIHAPAHASLYAYYATWVIGSAFRSSAATLSRYSEAECRPSEA